MKAEEIWETIYFTWESSKPKLQKDLTTIIFLWLNKIVID